jgi:hypothetical protein
MHRALRVVRRHRQLEGVTDRQSKCRWLSWFVDSLLTHTLIVHFIRANRIPFIQSRARWQLTLTSLGVMAIGT